VELRERLAGPLFAEAAAPRQTAVHHFYLGKVGTGLLMVFTFGDLGIWAFVDFIIIVAGSMRDSDGLPVTQSELNKTAH